MQRWIVCLVPAMVAALMAAANPNGSYTLRGDSYEVRNGNRRNADTLRGTMNLDHDRVTGVLVDDPAVFNVRLNQSVQSLGRSERPAINGTFVEDEDSFTLRKGTFVFKVNREGRFIYRARCVWIEEGDDNPTKLVTSFQGVRR